MLPGVPEHGEKKNNKKIGGREEFSPNWILSIKGIVYKRTCNPTTLVHQDMTKKTTFFLKKMVNGR